MNAQKYYYVVVKNPLELHELSNNQNDYETIVYVTTDGSQPINREWSHSRHETLREAIKMADKVAAQLGKENGLGADYREADDYAKENYYDYAVIAGEYAPVADFAINDVMGADDFISVANDINKYGIDTVVGTIESNTGSHFEKYQLHEWLIRKAKQACCTIYDKHSYQLTATEVFVLLIECGMFQEMTS